MPDQAGLYRIRLQTAEKKKAKKSSTGQTRNRQTIQQQQQVECNGGEVQTFPDPGLERDSVLWKTQPVVAMMNDGVNSAVHCGWQGGRGRQRQTKFDEMGCSQIKTNSMGGQ